MKPSKTRWNPSNPRKVSSKRNERREKPIESLQSGETASCLPSSDVTLTNTLTRAITYVNRRVVGRRPLLTDFHWRGRRPFRWLYFYFYFFFFVFGFRECPARFFFYAIWLGFYWGVWSFSVVLIWITGFDLVFSFFKVRWGFSWVLSDFTEFHRYWIPLSYWV